MEISLKGRSALITGGSEGLGKGMAMRFAQSGADVAILARRPEVLDRAKADLNKVSDRKVIAIPCDLLNSKATASTPSPARHSGRLDSTICTAPATESAPTLMCTRGRWASAGALTQTILVWSPT